MTEPIKPSFQNTAWAIAYPAAAGAGHIPQTKSPIPLNVGTTVTAQDFYHTNPERAIQFLLEENAALRKQILTDPVTGLSSKAGFDKVLESHVAQKLSGRHHSKEVAVIRIDLDGFKPINDIYGHQAGDEYFKIFGQRIQHEFRKDDVVARVGGDEFCVLALDTEPNEIKRKIERVFEASKNWSFNIHGEAIHFRGFSYGVATSEELAGSLSVTEAMKSLDKMADDRACTHKLRTDKAASSERGSAPVAAAPAPKV